MLLSFSVTLFFYQLHSHVLVFPLWVFGAISASRLPGPVEAKTMEAFQQVSMQPEIIIIFFFSVFWWSIGRVVISNVE